MHYRFHGRFISASDAARIANLKSASKYLSTDTPSGRIQGYKSPKSVERSEAAQRGWETRRAREAEQARLDEIRRAAREHQAQVKRAQAATDKVIREIRRQEKAAPPKAEVIPFPSRAPAPAQEYFGDEDEDEDAYRAPQYWDEEEEEEAPSDFYEGEFQGFEYDDSAIGDCQDLDIQLLDETFADLDEDGKYKSAS